MSELDQNELKRLAACAALNLIAEDIEPRSIIGVGTGSTVNFFIDSLVEIKDSFRAAVSSSIASTARLKDHGITVLETHKVERADVYVDGADEVDGSRSLIKGGGGALTQEKIVTSISDRFICIVDESKVVDRLGAFPLPIEVVPSARTAIKNFVHSIGGDPHERAGLTENGNLILDVGGLEIDNPNDLEQTINNLPGVVTVGLFAAHKPDLVLIAQRDGSIASL